MRVDYEELFPALKRLLPKDGLDFLGDTTRFIRRLRSVSASMFVWSVVLSRFGQGVPGFDQARRWFKRLSETPIWPRPFQMRFKKPEAVQLFEQAFDEAVKPWRSMRRRLRHPLAQRFADVVAWDSSLVQVADSLRKHFKGTRAAAASLKVVLGVSVWGLLPLVAQVVAGNRHDMILGPPLEQFRKGTLLLFDKGFVAYQRLREIDEAELLYLCPMRLNGGATIIGVHSAPAKVKKALRRNDDGVSLRSLLPKDKCIRKKWDLEVVVFSRAKGHKPVRTRLVIVPGPGGKQRPYLTNLCPRLWHPEALAELYRLRWQIELVFKEMKQHLKLTSVPSKDPYAVQVFVWASLIALAVSRTVADWLAPLRRYAGLSFVLRPAVLTRALRSHIRLLGHALTLPFERAVDLLEVLAVQLLDEARQRAPNRTDSFKRLETLLSAA
jgi:putative transposase